MIKEASLHTIQFVYSKNRTTTIEKYPLLTPFLPMKQYSVYLNFNGRTEEAFNFYRSVLGGELTMLQRFKDYPQMGPVPDNEKDRILHVSLSLGKAGVLMGSDTLESRKMNVLFGNNAHISLEPESEEEAKRLFDGLSAGGKVDFPLQKTFWGALYGMFADRYGVLWMINYTYPPR
ncbi:MAG: hypothetical protein A4E32_00698 [Methanomassiliicoccales archaeon PtaU1.Bin124]|nr:MAG: hypothetical protein A4E32_00698 [Methanomassiliicoccales archaeon PtaU1.Bin124]